MFLLHYKPTRLWNWKRFWQKAVGYRSVNLSTTALLQRELYAKLTLYQASLWGGVYFWIIVREWACSLHRFCGMHLLSITHSTCLPWAPTCYLAAKKSIWLWMNTKEHLCPLWGTRLWWWSALPQDATTITEIWTSTDHSLMYTGKKIHRDSGRFHCEMHKRTLENQNRAENSHRLQCKGLSNIGDLCSGMLKVAPEHKNLMFSLHVRQAKKKIFLFSGAPFHIPLTKSATLNRLLHCSLWQFSGALFCISDFAQSPRVIFSLMYAVNKTLDSQQRGP